MLVDLLLWIRSTQLFLKEAPALVKLFPHPRPARCHCRFLCTLVSTPWRLFAARVCWTASLLQQEWTDLQEPGDPAHVPAGPSETHAVLRHHAGPPGLHQVICPDTAHTAGCELNLQHRHNWNMTGSIWVRVFQLPVFLLRNKGSCFEFCLVYLGLCASGRLIIEKRAARRCQ